ncbi:MAG: amidohydrolase [Chloroflexi bacterium]|nr:amidohydrolase [Ardenticatenaceae bacterium]MBL1127079.1 amidohydrolase [Chloroflexota bacterium]NOG33140.1 amidohydrolase [Chloroflexota bacterium]GIK54934.1 MAG: amidohydrolase [Chloroflexota bacterium]
MPQVDFRKEAESLFDEMVARRRDLHQYPEMGFEEFRTAGIVAEQLDQLGFEVQRGIGQTGVVALLDGPHDGPTVMLRFDMDGLPIQEESGQLYASKNAGVMHACGHDGHTSMGLALAKIMAKYREEMHGRIKFVFQPAEEGLGGAFAMIADGVLENPRPDVTFAMHIWTPEDVGNVRVVEGPCMASSSVFTITIHGFGGHGAAPHLANDPIVAAAHIVTALQSIVSRNINPQESVVVSIGEFRAGATFNVIPDKAILKGTVRSYNNELHRLIYRRILEMATRMAEAFGCKASMETIAIVQAVVNAPEPTAVVRAAAEKIVGADRIMERRTMASEDMGFFLDEIPGCYFFIGGRNEEKEYIYPHHHPKFNFDERAMIDGVAIMGEAAAHYVLNSA